LGCLNYVLQEGCRWDWFSNVTITICAVISALSGIGFAFRTLTSAQPIVDLRALANRNFSLGCLLSFVTGVGIFCLTCLTVLFLGRVRGFIAWQDSGTMLWAGLFQLCAFPIFGLACFAISMWLFTPITNQWQLQEMLTPLAFRGVAVAFALASTTTLALRGLAPDRLPSASGLFA
jgi:DHA2 family multidrug resistance protein